MNNSSVATRRGRASISVAAVAGLVLTGAAAFSTPAQSAEPAGDCAVAYPVADLTKGDPVDGLTVSSGTTPEGFTGEVLGVLHDGIAPGLDMIMVRLESDEIDRVGGIWQGMSGSPVYADDGRVIGAVAYGLSWGPSPVAGVTPFEQMDDYLAAESRPGKIRVSKAQARTIARESSVTAAQANEGFSQLKMPLGVSGVGARRLAQAKHSKKHQWLPKSSYAMGAAAAPGDGPGPETIVAGGNMAASLSYGDISMAGVGTATSVCDGRVVGFGHPMTFLGETSLSLHPADALFVQEESLGAPFKLANLGAPAGTIADDHLTGITGSFGALPATSLISASTAFRTRARTGETHVSVPEATASATFFQLLVNTDTVVDGVTKGSSLLSWTINGHDGADPFSISVTDRFASDFDISFESAWELADFVWSLSAIQGVTIDEVISDADVVSDNSTWRVRKVEQARKGEWHSVTRKTPALGKAGRNIRLRVALSGASGELWERVKVMVPTTASGTSGRLNVMGGGSMWSEDQYPSSVKQAERYAANLVRNDQVAIELALSGKRKETTSQTLSSPLEEVVYGRRSVGVVIK